MPRYFFHLTDGREFIRDEDGVEIDGPSGLDDCARRAVREIVADNPDVDWNGWTVEVTDQGERILLRLPLSPPGEQGLLH